MADNLREYRKGVHRAEATQNSRVTQAIQGRRSIRRYVPGEEGAVPRETIEEILRAGIQAPSAKNRQPWSFVVAAGRAKEEALDAMEAGLERERTSPLLPESAAHLPDAWQSLKIMRQAPVVIFVVNPLGVKVGESLTVDEHVTEICNAQSIGAAMENIALAAWEQGLGSLWICNTFFAQRELRSWLRAEGELYAAMALGYANETPQARPRRSLEEVVEWRE
ncbi:MAG: nitroreductase family protein [Lachnospiraceae bacterium]|nr:nitroreductase family protein [Lachnospiraceae bacterium]